MYFQYKQIELTKDYTFDSIFHSVIVNFQLP